MTKLGGILAMVLVVAGCGGGGGGGAPAAGARTSTPKNGVDVGIKLQTDTMTLANGLVVVMHREPTERSVYVAIQYDVGSKDDPKGRAGLAHLFEHLMFKSPKHGGGREYSSWLEEVGARPNAWTNHDETRYHQSVAPPELPRALWLEADRMAYPAATIDEDTLRRERDVVKNEWREHYENQPYGHVMASAFREVFGAEHPYGLPTIGLPADLAAVTLDDVRAFARAYYRPNNATLVICGAFDPAAVKPLVERYFATIPPGPPRPMRSFPVPAVSRSRTVAIEADVPAPMVVMAWTAPRVHAAGWEPLHIGMDMFGNGVRHRLVTEKEIADDVDVFVTPRRLGSLAVVRVKTKPGVAPDAVVGVVDEYASKTTLYGSKYRYDRFPDLKTRSIVASVLRLDDMSERADALFHGLVHHGRADAVQEDLHAIGEVRIAEAAGAIEQFVNDAPRVTLVVKPTKGAPRAGRLVR